MNPSLPGGPASAVTATGPTHAVVREVGLRDGLQSISRVLPTAQKIEWVNAAYAAGQREIEVGSFVPARLLPQLADTAEVLAHAQTLPGLRASVLVPNLKGAERALECGAHLMVVPLSASHAHSLANLRKTPDEVVAEVARIRAARDAAGSATLIEGGVGTAFGCTLQGEVAESEVLRLMQALLDAGADRVSLADTVGFADPASVQRLFAKARALVGDRLACAHFHDTRGMGLANAYAAWQTGLTRFDACLPGGHWWLPSRARRQWQCHHRRPGIHAAAHGRSHRRGCACAAGAASASGGLAGGRDPARRAVAGGPAPSRTAHPGRRSGLISVSFAHDKYHIFFPVRILRIAHTSFAPGGPAGR